MDNQAAVILGSVVAEQLEYASVRQNGTLRDKIAIAALQGLVAHTGSAGLNHGCADLSERAYQLAEAMLAEKAKREAAEVLPK